MLPLKIRSLVKEKKWEKNAGRKWGRQKVDIEVENTIKLTECSIYEKDTGKGI